jgi:hypothetical protein
MLALPAAVFTPVAVAAAWRQDRFVDPDSAGAAAVGLRVAYGLTTFGLSTALATVLYLAALRRLDAGRSPWPALRLAGGLAVLGTLAAAAQEFTYPFMLTGGGPGRTTATPLISVFVSGFQQLTFGPAAAASAMLLLLLAVLGVAAASWLIVTGARLEVDPAHRSADAPPGWDRNRATSMIVAKVLATVVWGVALYALWPWLRALFGHGTPPAGSGSSGQVLASTWLPPLLSTAVGVSAAALAGYGIGAVRPLGPRSELLLLPFAPFLFVGVGPLALRAYAGGDTVARLDTMLALAPPTRLAVPALFLFTLLARGLALNAGGGDGGPPRIWRAYLRPGLPMIGIVAAATWLVSAQDLLWPALSGVARRHAPGPLLLLFDDASAAGGAAPVSLALPGWLVLPAVAAAVAAQLAYLDRVALRVGAPERAS